MPFLQIRRAALVVVLASAAALVPLSGLHAAPGDRARQEKPVRTRAVAPPSFFTRLISAVWEAAGVRIDDNGIREDIRKDAGVRIDDNG